MHTDAELTSVTGDAGSVAVVGRAMIARDRFHRPEAQTEHSAAGGDVAAADEPQADQPGGDEAVLAEPGSVGAAAAAGGDGGEITAAGALSSLKGRGLSTGCRPVVLLAFGLRVGSIG